MTTRRWAYGLALTTTVVAGWAWSSERASTASERVQHLDLAAERESVAAQMRELSPGARERIEREGRGQGLDLRQFLEVGRGRLDALADEKIFRVIEGELKPIPIAEDGFRDVFTGRTLELAAVPTGAEAELMQRRARSVGRIERDGDSKELIGTGFVVGDGLVATNCHVLRRLLAADKAAGGPLAGRFLVDFGERSDHVAAQEYVIEGVAGQPATRYLDVAFLRVATKSVAGARALPDSIPLRRTRPEPAWPKGVPRIAVIGYPDLANVEDADPLTQATFRRIRERAAGVAKVLSPGEIVGLDQQGGIEFLDHIASTHQGQSGSPVLDRATGEAVGIHFCCTRPGLPPALDSLECSSQRLSDRRNNEAVSAWSAASNDALRPLLGKARAAIRLPQP